AEDPAGHAAVAGGATRTAGHPLLDLVDEQDAWRDRFGHAYRGAQVLLTAPDVPGEDAAHVQSQQRQLPLHTGAFGREALAAAGHTGDQHTLGKGQLVLAQRPVVEPRARTLPQPVPQDVEATDVAETLLLV